jgi:hypothetical protein
VVKLIPPVSGQWALPTFPSELVLDGISFKKARWRAPSEAVVAQYRQDVPVDSAHLKVFRDGSWAIDHLDEINPDWSASKPLVHLIADHPAGRLATAYSYISLAHAMGLFSALD